MFILFLNYLSTFILWISFGATPALMFNYIYFRHKDESKKTILMSWASLIFWPITVLCLMYYCILGFSKWWTNLPDE